MENKFDEIRELIINYIDKINQAQINTNLLLQEKNKLELKLDKLRENREQEIRKYINRFSNQSNFYVKYGAMVKKDLEQAYIKQEERLVKELNLLENVNQVDDLRKEFQEKLTFKRVLLDLQLYKEQLEYEDIMNILTSFKYEYDENQKIINGNNWRNIFERSNRISDNIDSIKYCMKFIDWYLNQLNLTYKKYEENKKNDNSDQFNEIDYKDNNQSEIMPINESKISNKKIA